MLGNFTMGHPSANVEESWGNEIEVKKIIIE
jgi:hypothetical protein